MAMALKDDEGEEEHIADRMYIPEEVCKEESYESDDL